MRHEKTGLISIALATYNPNMQWLREQLLSLNAQDYPSLELLVIDDASDSVAADAIHALLKECVTAFPFSFDANEGNQGCTDTYAALTRRAEGAYIAYCDQDDIWLPHKLSALRRSIEKERALLACSDMTVIDEEGRQLAASLRDLRKRVVYRSGANVAPALLFANFASGCAMIVRTQTAKEALPFVGHIVYDHWLALYAASRGNIAFIDEPLIRHRVHGSNQTNTVADVHTKRDYIERRVIPYEKRIQALRGRVDLGRVQRDAEAWAQARVAYAAGDRGAGRTIWKHRKLDPKVSFFELLLPVMPERGFRQVIRSVRRGVI